MHKFLRMTCLAGLILTPFLAMAAPSAYNDSEWEVFLNDSKTTTIPKGEPNTAGAVRAWFEDVFPYTSGRYFQIDSPLNMSESRDIAISNYAKEYGMLYTSKTAKTFLEATVKKMRELVQDESVVIPVFALYPKLAIPMFEEDENIFGISFGVYQHTDDGPVSFPDTYLTGSGVQDSDARETPMNDINEMGYQYALFSNAIPDKQQRVVVQNPIIPGKALQTQRWHTMRQTVLRQIEREWDQIVDQADELSIDNARMIGKVNPKMPNTSQIVEKLKQNNDRRMTKSMRNQRRDDRSSHNDFNKYIDVDLKYTWYMLEAALTQTAAEIVEIHMPYSFQNDLMKEAKKHSSDEIMNKFDALVVDDNYEYGGIHIILACSVHDRFLGCPIGGSKTLEAMVTEKSDLLIQSINNARTIDEKIKAIRLVTNANPVYVHETINTDALKQQIEYSLTGNKKEEGLYYLSLFEDIPVKKGETLFIRGVEVPEDILSKQEERRKSSIKEGRPKDTQIDLPF